MTNPLEKHSSFVMFSSFITAWDYNRFLVHDANDEYFEKVSFFSSIPVDPKKSQKFIASGTRKVIRGKST